MSYTKLTDFAAKDTLLSGNPSKLLRGTEIGAEFDAIESAMAAAESAMAAAEAVNITAPIIAASTSKTTPVGADVLPILDSAASNILKKVTWTNIKATLKTYFDTLYAAVGSSAASGANSDITSLSALTAGGLPNNSVLTADIADANVTPGKLSQPFTSGTAVATTSGTSVDITSIPSWVKRITICMNGVSTNGAGSADVMLRLGVGGVPETSGYLGAASRVNGAAIASAVLSTGVLTNGAGATSATTVQHATFVFNHIGSNKWSFTGQMGQEGTGQTAFVAGSKNLAGVLDMIRLTTSNGTDTFDAGSVNISYE